MKLLFIQGGSRWKLDTDGNLYTDSNFHNGIWIRYRSYCDELTVILRREETIYMKEEAQKRFNLFDKSLANYYMLPDIYRPVKNVFHLKMRREVEKLIKNEVRKTDKLIIRAVGTFYTDTALKYARKYGKPHLVEVTGFSWESYWYHSLRGKLYALFNELQCKRLLKDCPYAIYVTEKALQQRYPNRGASFGCSDVELLSIDETILKKRQEKIKMQNNHSKLIIGTAAFLDVHWKGQEYVIKALSQLKKRGITNLEYQLIGSGTGKYLMKTASQYGVTDQVTIVGSLSHEQVFQWMDTIDIYVQSSFTEGLCRAIVEAMSRACPVIASDVGGNFELVSKQYLFQKANDRALADRLQKMQSKEERMKEAKRNFEISRKFRKEDLDQKRDAFYLKFMKET